MTQYAPTELCSGSLFSFKVAVSNSQIDKIDSNCVVMVDGFLESSTGSYFAGANETTYEGTFDCALVVVVGQVGVQ